MLSLVFCANLYLRTAPADWPRALVGGAAAVRCLGPWDCPYLAIQ